MGRLTKLGPLIGTLKPAIAYNDTGRDATARAIGQASLADPRA